MKKIIYKKNCCSSLDILRLSRCYGIGIGQEISSQVQLKNWPIVYLIVNYALVLPGKVVYLLLNM